MDFAKSRGTPRGYAGYASDFADLLRSSEKPFNLGAVGSSPTGLTNEINGLRAAGRAPHGASHALRPNSPPDAADLPAGRAFRRRRTGQAAWQLPRMAAFCCPIVSSTVAALPHPAGSDTWSDQSFAPARPTRPASSRSRHSRPGTRCHGGGPWVLLINARWAFAHCSRCRPFCTSCCVIGRGVGGGGPGGTLLPGRYGQSFGRTSRTSSTSR